MNSNQKGKRGERELAEYLREHGHDARRGQQFSGSPDSPDVVSESLGLYHIECKRVESGNLYNWLSQAKRDAGAKTPVVMHKRNRQEWVAILDLYDFLQLVERADGNKVHPVQPHTEGESEKPALRDDPQAGRH